MNGLFADVALSNIENAVNTIDGISNNSQFKEMQTSITASIHNAVHAIVDYYERVDRTCLNHDEDSLFCGFMYVNNQLKHDKNLQSVTYNVSGSMFPLFFPFRFGPPGVSWAGFVDNGRPSARGKRSHYEQMLMNKDVRNTLEMVQDIILRLNDEQ